MQTVKNNPNDGRHARFVRLHDKLVSACRVLMAGGNFQPSMALVCAETGCSLRSGFQHFKNNETMYREALEDQAVRRCILLSATDGHTCCLDWPPAIQESVLYALVMGRRIPPMHERKAA